MMKTFWAKRTKFEVVFLILCAGLTVYAIGAGVVDAIETFKFSHLSPGDHLRLAKASLDSPSLAARHLESIPTNASEHAEAVGLLTAIRKQREDDSLRAEKVSREREQASRDQMIRNRQGAAHDAFRCNTSTDGKPIMSFDNGQYWWLDDGRCAEQLQNRRDQDAQWYSYWSTTIRVDADMNSSWLDDEERTCRTYPDGKGRISKVVCGSSNSQDHSIPVKFWGGVDRNTVSSWRCRRESDAFVCRAID